MTETRFTWRWLLVIAAVGIFMGLVVGLAAGWIIFPNFGSSNVAGLSASAQNDYIVLVANTYSYDQDLARARQRLNALEERDLMARVERLAKALAARNDPSAANVADLAIALGSESAELIPFAEIAASDGWGADAAFTSDFEPTKVARIDNSPPTETQNTVNKPEETQDEPLDNNDSDVTPTPDGGAGEGGKVKPQQQTRIARLTATAQAAPPEPEATEPPAPTEAPQAAAPPPAEPTAVPPTPEPTAVPQPQAAPVTTEFLPGYPAGWWGAVKFQPANVAPGQSYWHLKYARYCDWAPTDEYDLCAGFPGGGSGVGIWIMTVDESGACVETEVTDILNDGSQHPLTLDMRKTIAYPWNPYGFSCDQNYEKEMYGEGNTISVPGLPSDTITDLQLCATNPPAGHNPPPCGHAHVRYFLIFQRTTR